MEHLNKNIGTFCEKCRKTFCICTTEKTFEKLVEEIHYDITDSFRKDDILKLLQQVRDATAKECSIMANEHGSFYTCDEIDFKVSDTNYIKIYK